MTGACGFGAGMPENSPTSRPDESVFRRFRIAILLYILVFVALGEFLAEHRATDWNNTLWVDVYLVNGTSP